MDITYVLTLVFYNILKQDIISILKSQYLTDKLL